MFQVVHWKREMRVQLAVKASSFQRLERQARRLQWAFAGLFVTVALLPTSVFVIIEISHLRVHAQRDAGQLALVLASQMAQSDFDLSVISAKLKQEMQVNGHASLRLKGAGGGVSLNLGEPGRPFLPTGVVLPLPPSAAPFEEMWLAADDRPLFREAARVLGIHLLVAALLALIVYRVPMRALRLAISEGKATHAQLVHSDKLSAIGEMYAGLTHEINNPLSIILSRVRLMLATAEDRRLPPQLIRDLQLIDRHGSRIADVIRSLLAFARKETFDLAETDLNGVIKDVVALVDNPFGKHSLRIEPLLDPSLPRIRASRNHLQQVFLNLLNNARDAMPAGGTIVLRTYANAYQVIAEVQDTGTGIPDDIQGRIFEPFVTTKREGKGTGLGLSVSYGIVRAHGGEIEVESSPGTGALFRLRFPLKGMSP